MMKKQLPLLLLLFRCALTAQPVTDPGFDSNFAAALHASLQQQGGAVGIRHLSACVYVPGQGSWVGVYNHWSVPPISTDARFGIASNSKAFVAALCLRLKSEGLLHLDAPISTYLPNLSQITPYVSGSITTRQLLNHQAGLFDFYNQATSATIAAFNQDPDRLWLPEEVLATIGPPNHSNGASYYYSNTHFLVAAMVCEAITGKKFGQLLQEKIAQPLGLTHTNYPAGGDPVSNLPFAPLYNSAGTALALDMAHANSFWSTIQAAGGIASTAWDMVQWYRNGLFEKIPSPNVLGKLFDYHTQRELFEVEPWSSYSLGLRASNGEDGGSFLYHAGAWGYRSYIMYDVETGITVCVLGNQYGKSVTGPAKMLYKIARTHLPAKAKDLEILDVLAPKGQICSPGKLRLHLKNTGTQPLDSATLLTNLEPDCCLPPLAISFSPALLPGDSLDWESTDDFTSPISGSAQLNVTMSAGSDYYPFRASEKSFFAHNPDWSQHALPLPYFQNFSQLPRGKLPEGWLSYQPDNVMDWHTSHLAGNGGALCKNNFDDGAEGQAYFLELPVLLPGLSDVLLRFDYAYAPNTDLFPDSLFVEFSSDCGEHWQTLWENGGTGLQTTTATNNSFRPTSAGQWETASVLVPGNGSGEVLMLRYKAISHYGNNIWLDNVGLSQLVPAEEAVAFPGAQFSPNPMQSLAVLQVENPLQSATLTVYDVLGNRVLEKQHLVGNLVQLERGNLLAGAYFFALKEKERLMARGKLVVH